MLSAVGARHTLHSGHGAVMGQGATIFGCLDATLSPREARFFADTDPWGFILFARNIETPDQVRALCADLRDSVDRDAPILIDQEGGRVARLRPPYWGEWAAPATVLASAGSTHAARAMWLRYRVIAAELTALGIDTNCAPMADVPTADAHDIIKDRCYGDNPTDVARLSMAVADGLMAGGVLPVVKHMPGHGRAVVDSHIGLPVVDADEEDLQDIDFAAFAELADLPLGMTAHVIYSAIDNEYCATQSEQVIDVIRHDIGFDGLLMTDDLSMSALSGSHGDRTAAALAAGCDVILHCNADMAEMSDIASEAGQMTQSAQARADQAIACRQQPEPANLVALEAEYRALTDEVMHA